MASSRNPEELLNFPCFYEFKAFGETADEQFHAAVFQAVNRIVPIREDALRARSSSGGRYQCLSVRVWVESGSQLEQIYAMLRAIEGLRYLI